MVTVLSTVTVTGLGVMVYVVGGGVIVTTSVVAGGS